MPIASSISIERFCARTRPSAVEAVPLSPFAVGATMLCRATIQTVLILSALLLRVTGHPQESDENTPRPGRYVPALYGADRGRYMPDDSGKYRHIKVPYDGGYGDRGEKYIHDARGYLPPEGFSLGPSDHLRFMIDFNYNDSGWQILQFDWVRDDDAKRQYKYVNENQLWDPVEVNYEQQSAAEASTGAAPADNENTNIHVDGAYRENMFNVRYSNDNAQNAPSQTNIQDTIREVLEYIQTYILPTLT